MRLVYHQIGADKGVSPFDVALREVATKAPLLRLASPYIGLGFLERILDSADDWQLLSDIEAWLQSGNRKHRARCWSFISGNLPRIRHVAGLHAKVAIGNEKLFMGSANFTERGILGRAELSILIPEAEQVREAKAWFDSLWDVACAPVLEEGDALIAALDSAEWTTQKVRVRLTSTAPQVAAILAETERPDGFDLAGVMAEAGIAESSELVDLEDAYRRISDEWRGGERAFTFKELLKAVNEISRGRAKDVWPLITTETANHWLGGLDPDGFDRYVYEDGEFRAFSSPADNSFTTRLGEVLVFVLETLPMFPDHARLPMEAEWRNANVPESHVLPIVELLLDAGLLIEHDIPGELESYSIEPRFDWPKRWGKFRQAQEIFNRLSIEVQSSSEMAPTEDAEFEENDQGCEEKLIAKIIRRDMLNDAGGALPRSDETDKLLAALFEVLAEMPKPMRTTHNEVASELKAGGIPDKILRIIQDKDAGPLRTDRSGGLDFNKRWAGEYFLQSHPMALDAWRKAIQADGKRFF